MPTTAARDRRASPTPIRRCNKCRRAIPELGPLIRSVFLPEEGEFWAKPDVAQQEFRLLVHYAVQHELRGAQEAADAYRNNPDADFHNVVAEMTGLDRRRGQGNKFRQDLRCRREEDG